MLVSSQPPYGTAKCSSEERQTLFLHAKWSAVSETQFVHAKRRGEKKQQEHQEQKQQQKQQQQAHHSSSRSSSKSRTGAEGAGAAGLL